METVTTRRRSLKCISPPICVHRQTDRQTRTHNDGQIEQSHNLFQFTSFSLAEIIKVGLHCRRKKLYRLCLIGCVKFLPCRQLGFKCWRMIMCCAHILYSQSVVHSVRYALLSTVRSRTDIVRCCRWSRSK